MRRIMRPMARGSFSSRLENSPSIAPIAASMRASSAGSPLSPPGAAPPAPGSPFSPAPPGDFFVRPVKAKGDMIFSMGHAALSGHFGTVCPCASVLAKNW